MAFATISNSGCSWQGLVFVLWVHNYTCSPKIPICMLTYQVYIQK